eukprot:7051735-Prorocentrum_lima.AAC.1
MPFAASTLTRTTESFAMDPVGVNVIRSAVPTAPRTELDGPDSTMAPSGREKGKSSAKVSL